MSARSILVALLATSVLGACSTPYGGKLAIDYSKRPIPGSITVSDAKLYRREALINERRREVDYIDKLMGETEKLDFAMEPEINREIEVIRSLAINAGLNFDPAAGQSFRNSSKTEALQQEFNVLEMQLKLDQLKRDAELFRSDLAKKTEPSRDDLGKPPTAGTPATPPALTPPDTDKLVKRIDDLQAALIARLEKADIPPPRGVTVKGNYIDRFRDRAAYRQVLTTARNAASLDELHDLDGAALYRLTFQATTLAPPKGYGQTAGVVSMRLADKDQPDDAEAAEIYLRWLDFLNQSLVETKSADPVRLDIQNLLAGGAHFDGLQLLFTPDVTAAPDKACKGLVSYAFSAKACSKALIVVPALEPASTSFAGENLRMRDIVEVSIPRLERDFDRALVALRDPLVRASLLAPTGCQVRPAAERATLSRDTLAGQTDGYVSAALSTLAAVPLLTPALRRLAASSISPNAQVAVADELDRLRGASERAATALALLGAGRCDSGERLQASQSVVVPAEFRSVINQASQVRVYEVGPRQQVQQVSTAARAADAFSLALAISAKAPSAGIGGNAGLGLARSAAGKVDAVERLPVVVGYAQTSDSQLAPQFGWILGPRITTIDARKGKLDLEQGPQVYDLSADLSVAGWRTRLKLAVGTAWAPDMRTIGKADAPDNSRNVTVQLRPSTAEFAALTQRLVEGPGGGGQRYAAIRTIRPDAISACAAATLVIIGDNLWRATEIIVGGRRLGGDKIAVLPDMQGITAEIPANTEFPDINAQRVDVQVLTPYGVAAKGEDRLMINGFGAKGCTEPPK